MGAILLALGISFLLVCLFYPTKKKWPVDDYLALLSPSQWKEEAEIYESIIKIHPNLTLNDHNSILFLLHSEKRVEKLTVQPHQLDESGSPNKFGTRIQGVEPFANIVSVNYKLINSSGGHRGKRKRSGLLPEIVHA